MKPSFHFLENKIMVSATHDPNQLGSLPISAGTRQGGHQYSVTGFTPKQLDKSESLTILKSMPLAKGEHAESTEGP